MGLGNDYCSICGCAPGWPHKWWCWNKTQKPKKPKDNKK